MAKFTPDMAMLNAVKGVLRKRHGRVEHVHTVSAKKNSSVAESTMRRTEAYVKDVGKTPLLELKEICRDNALMCSLFAKCEFLNPGGTFEARHAANAMEKVQEQQRQPSRITCASSLGFPDADANEDITQRSTSEFVVEETPVLIHHLGSVGALFSRVNELPSICIENRVKSLMYSRSFDAHGGFLFQAAREEVHELRRILPHSIVIPTQVFGDSSVIEEIENDLGEMRRPSQIHMLVCSLPFFNTNPRGFAALQKDCQLVVVGRGSLLESHQVFPVAQYYDIDEQDEMVLMQHARKLYLKEGLFCSPDSALVVWAALEAVVRFDFKFKTNRNVVLILDEAFHPFSKREAVDIVNLPALPCASAQPMTSWWFEQVIGDIKVKSPAIVDPDMQIEETIRALRALDNEYAVVQLPSPSNVILGVTSVSLLESQVQHKNLDLNKTLGGKGATFKKFHIVKFDTPLKVVVQKLFKDKYVCVIVQPAYDFVAPTKSPNKSNSLETSSPSPSLVQVRRDIVLGLVTQFDILEYISRVDEHHLKVKTSWHQYK